MTPWLRLGASVLVSILGVLVSVGGGAVVGFSLADQHGPGVVAGLLVIYLGAGAIGLGYTMNQRRARRVGSAETDRGVPRGPAHRGGER